jgi:hypothetical protein
MCLSITCYSGECLQDAGLHYQVDALRVQAKGLNELHQQRDEIGLHGDSVGQGLQKRNKDSVLYE